MARHDRVSGKKLAARALSAPSDSSQSITGPPEFVRAAEMQRAYWTHDPDEQARLEARGADRLEWRERLRLHHLICLQRIGSGPEDAAATEKCRQSMQALLGSDSPYRAQMALLWEDKPVHAGAARPPDMTGEFLNASLTHLGSLEVIHVDAEDRPTRLDFVSVDELDGVEFGQPTLMRAARLRYVDHREELVLVPLLYGLTWTIGDKSHRQGEYTSFVAPLSGEEFGALGTTGIGVGQQDLWVHNLYGSSRLVGMASVAEIAFPFDVRDPGFDAEARARGLDPNEARRRSGGA